LVPTIALKGDEGEGDGDAGADDGDDLGGGVDAVDFDVAVAVVQSPTPLGLRTTADAADVAADAAAVDASADAADVDAGDILDAAVDVGGEGDSDTGGAEADVGGEGDSDTGGAEVDVAAAAAVVAASGSAPPNITPAVKNGGDGAEDGAVFMPVQAPEESSEKSVEIYALSCFGWGLAGAVALKADKLRWIPGQKSARYDIAGFVSLISDWPITDEATLKYKETEGGEWKEVEISTINLITTNLSHLGSDHPIHPDIECDDGTVLLPL
jgi:hypothetical protein